MLMSVSGNENNRWKKNVKKTKNKDRREQGGGTKAIVKEWELNDFVVRLS